MPQSTPHRHQLSHIESNKPPMQEIDSLFDMSFPRLSLCRTFQPTGVLGIEACRFERCAGQVDMYKGDVMFVDHTSSLPIVAKVFRVLRDDHERNEDFEQMVNTLQEDWSTVGHHEYISPIWSASLTLENFVVPAIATPHYRNGNVLDYLGRHPGANRLNIVRQATSALGHIHSKGVIHGNFCPENICVTDDGMVRVTDIAVNTSIRQTTSRDSLSVPSNWMYKPREELQSGDHTTQTDVYSLATTIYAIYTLRPPFLSNTHSYGKGLMQIVRQGHDGTFGSFKPAQMSNQLWVIIRMCWALDPSQRPSIVEVEGNLRKMCTI